MYCRFLMLKVFKVDILHFLEDFGRQVECSEQLEGQYWGS